MTALIVRRPGTSPMVFRPFHRPMSLIDEIEDIASDLWTAWRPLVSSNNLIPHTEMYEENDQLVMKTELPGIKKEDLDITLDGDMLTIKAEKKPEETAEDAAYHARERYYGRYYRTTSLPFRVDGDKSSAVFENGVLELRLPKSEETKAKKIEVKAQITEAKEKKQSRKRKKTAS